MRDARTRLIMKRPFYGFPSMNLRLVEGACPTMQTDGVRLVYNPEWIAQQSDSDRQLQIAHETLHCMLGHPFRRNGRDPETWNQACDYVVNGLLRKDHFTVPSGALIDGRYDGMSAEQVYEVLYRQPQKPQQKPDDVLDCPGDSGGDSDGMDDKEDKGKPQKDKSGKGKPSNDPEPHSLTPQEVEAKWKNAVVQASHLTRAAGSEAGGMDEIVEAAKQPYIDWRSRLREFVSTTVPHDYRMFPPNRRHLWRGMYLPSIARRPCPKLVVAIDTSGSVSGQLLAQFVCELNSIMAEMKCLIHVLTCDTQVKHFGTFDDEPIGEIHAYGRGGTRFDPPFQWAHEHAPEIDGLIYLTDGYASFPKESHFKTLWVIASNVKAPWGDAVAIPSV